MAKRRTERNRTNKNTNTISQQRARAAAAIDGRGGRLAAYTGGARTAEQFRGVYNMSEADGQREAWQNRRNVSTYTHTPSGLLSVNGKNTKNAYTNTFTPKNDDGSPVLNSKGEVRQSGRSEKANRRQRDYDVRKGMNNISPRVIEAWKRLGMVREVDGSLVGQGDRVITQKADGNYSMGLSVG